MTTTPRACGRPSPYGVGDEVHDAKILHCEREPETTAVGHEHRATYATIVATWTNDRVMYIDRNYAGDAERVACENDAITLVGGSRIDQADVSVILDALGIAGAKQRVGSTFEIVQREVLPAITALIRSAEGLASDENSARADELRRTAHDLVYSPAGRLRLVAVEFRRELAEQLLAKADELWPDPDKVEAMSEAIREALMAMDEWTSEDELDEDEVRELAHHLVRGGKVKPA